MLGGRWLFTCHCVLTAPCLAQAHNNQFDVDGSNYFYCKCQELKVPMIIVSRHCAYSCPMPRSIYGMCREKISVAFPPHHHVACF